MKVVIVGGTHPNTLSIVRSMGMRGVNVDVILCDEDRNDSYVLASKYIEKWHIVNDVTETIAILEKEYSDALTILCSDDVAALLNEQNAHFMDKQRQMNLAHNIGLAVPKSKVIRVGQDGVEFDAYPCIVKPLASIHGGKRIDICDNPAELAWALGRYDKGSEVLVQQYIMRDYEIVIDGVSLSDGNVVIPGFVRKHRDVQGGTTYATTYSISHLPEKMVYQIQQMIKTMGYEGLFGVEFIVSNNEYFFIEINLRNDATTYALAVAGVNLPYIYYLYKSGMNYLNEARSKIRIINAMMEIRDVSFALKGKVTPWQWLKDLKGCECRYYYNKDDVAPYRKARNQYISSLIGKVLKKLK